MKKKWLLAGIVGAAAAAVYFASVVSYAFPGESARLRALWSGLNPSGDVSHPLMSIFSGLFGHGNMIAPVCGIIAAMAVFLLVSTFVGSVANSEGDKPQSHTLGLIAGCVAAFVFMLTPGVREAASHLEPRLFEATWAFLAALLLVPYLIAPVAVAWLFPIVLGVMAALGCCDSAMFVVMALVCLFAITSVELRRGGKPYLPLTLFVATFLIAFFVAVGAFDMELTSLLKNSAQEVKSAFDTSGWIFVLIFTVIPFVVSLFSCPKAFSEKPGLVQWLFHIALSFFSILAVATPLSPSSILAKTGVTPVMTSAFAAAVVGYLIAFWWLHRKHPVGMVSGVVLAFVVAFASVWNLFTFDGSRGAFADEVARKAISELGGRKWIVTDGTLDDHILLVSKADGVEVNLIALQRDLDNKYLDYLSKVVGEKKIGGSKNEELVLSLSLGVLPFVQDWFSSDPTVGSEVVTWGAPDLWYASSVKPVPEFLFFGADPKRTPDWSEWKRFDKLLEAPAGWGSFRFESKDPVERLRMILRRHMGLVANNRGVWLQDAKRDDEAFDMYELVLNEIDRDNVCSLFNEIEMAGAKHKRALAKKRELERRVGSIIEDKTRRYVIWRLGSFYGYIRNPDMFVRMGFAWARSGRPGDALAQIRRAIDFVPDEKKVSLLNMMAALYASDNDQGKSRRIYEAVLKRNDKDHDALIGMMRLSLVDGDVKAATGFLERAVKAAATNGRSLFFEKAMLFMMRSDIDGAKSLLRKVLDADGRNLQAWGLLAAATMQQIDATADGMVKAKLLKEIEESILPAMEKNATNPYDYYVQSTKAFLLMRQGKAKRREARDAFEAAARARPDSMTTQDLVLGLDISLDDRANAERHARDVLRRNRNAPLANYVMGALALNRGRYREAESFLRKAVNTPRPHAMAMNDLAEVLRRTERLPEAEQQIRKGIEMSPNFYILHETLASILMDQNRNLDEAEASIRKAIELFKGEKKSDADMRTYMSLARVQVLRGDMKGAKASIRRVQSKISELSDFEKSEFEEIKKSVR